MQNKHDQVLKTKKIGSTIVSLESSLGLILCYVEIVEIQVEIVIRSTLASIRKRHDKKLFNI